MIATVGLKVCQGTYNIVPRLVVTVCDLICVQYFRERTTFQPDIQTDDDCAKHNEACGDLQPESDFVARVQDKRFAPEQWEGTLRRIYVEWTRAGNTKSGKRHFSRHDRPPVISLPDGPAKEAVTYYAGPCAAQCHVYRR
jgi:hypothetical protein